MKMNKAKVLATGEEIIVLENENEPGVYTTWSGDKVYKADELEILTDTGDGPALGGIPQMPKYEPLDSTADVIKELLEKQQGHFWRDQRVEIVKILLRENAPIDEVVEVADGIIQKLKAYGD